MKRVQSRKEPITQPAANLYRSLVEDDARCAGTKRGVWSMKAPATGHLKFHHKSGTRVHAQPARG